MSEVQNRGLTKRGNFGSSGITPRIFYFEYLVYMDIKFDLENFS